MPAAQELLDHLTHKLHAWTTEFVDLLPNLVLAILLVAIGAIAARWGQRATHRVLEAATGNAPISQLLGTVARIAVFAVSVFVALGLLKLDKTVTSLLAGVGVVGLALGFAFQDIAANFMAGVIMAINRPFELDDYVEVHGHRGRVRHIQLRATTLETLDGLSVLIPNKDVFQNGIVNFTRTPQRRLEVAVGTAYCDDMPRVREVICQALRNLPNRLDGQEIEVLFDSFGDSSINCHVLVWLDRSDELGFRRARSEAMIKIKAAFDREGITIPFPIRTLDFGAQEVGGMPLERLRLRVSETAAE